MVDSPAALARDALFVSRAGDGSQNMPESISGCVPPFSLPSTADGFLRCVESPIACGYYCRKNGIAGTDGEGPPRTKEYFVACLRDMECSERLYSHAKDPTGLFSRPNSPRTE